MSSPSSQKLKVGDHAPDFKLPNQEGKLFELKDFSGKWLVLYFYPRDDTPGCTTQACSLRDSYDQISSSGACVVGVSKDNLNSHLKFKAKFKLNFDLLSDPKGGVIESYGAWGPKMFGNLGILRKTFIISPEGVIKKIYGRVTPQGHGEKVLEDLFNLKNLS